MDLTKNMQSMANMLRHLITATCTRKTWPWQLLDKQTVADRAMRANAPAHVGSQVLCEDAALQCWRRNWQLITFWLEVNVCLAGAPLFEERWIPDTGEIITV